MHINSLNQYSCSLLKLDLLKVSRCKHLQLNHMDLYITRKAMILRKYLSKCKQSLNHWFSLCKFILMKSKCNYYSVKQFHSNSYSKLGFHCYLNKASKSFLFPRMQGKNRVLWNTIVSQLCLLYSHRSHKRHWHYCHKSRTFQYFERKRFLILKLHLCK